ncbi:MAG: hypothetical protein M3Z66_18460, partial [Chloroflexota bacterium]|nr:hypothetical protein [Chloroflexota bacterium]
INGIMDIWDPGTDQSGSHAWEYWRDLVPAADLVLDEAGFTNTANAPPYITASPAKGGLADPFAQKVEDYRWAATLGKGVVIVDYEPYEVQSGMTATDPQARADVQWAIATYLLARGDYTYLVWRGHRQTPGEVYTEPEFSAAQVGAPSGDPYQSQGVWMRVYTNGLAVANSSATSPVDLDFPAGKYHDLYGNQVTSTTLQPHTGLTLLDDSAPSPTASPSPTAPSSPTPVPTLSPTPTATAAPMAPLTFTRKNKVKEGAMQFITVYYRPHTIIHIGIAYPNGSHQSRHGTTNAAGVLKYHYRQAAGKLIRSSSRATIVVKTAGVTPVAKTYAILFGPLDVMVQPSASVVGKTVVIWAHTRSHTMVTIRVVSPNGRYAKLSARTGKHGWAHTTYGISRSLLQGHRIKLDVLAQTQSQPAESAATWLTISAG